jgi:hypothetical protein
MRASSINHNLMHNVQNTRSTVSRLNLNVYTSKLKSGNLNLLEPSGPLQACSGLLA